jgi:hypothetical protein
LYSLSLSRVLSLSLSLSLVYSLSLSFNEDVPRVYSVRVCVVLMRYLVYIYS